MLGLLSSCRHTLKTVTVKVHVAVLPDVSVAVQVTVVVPTGKQDPDGGLQLAVTPGQLSLATGGGKVTTTHGSIFVAVRQPSFLIVTFRLLHSLKSMTPFPLPPEIAADWKTTVGWPVRQVFKVVVKPSVIVTLNGPTGLQR